MRRIILCFTKFGITISSFIAKFRRIWILPKYEWASECHPIPRITMATIEWFPKEKFKKSFYTITGQPLVIALARACVLQRLYAYVIHVTHICTYYVCVRVFMYVYRRTKIETMDVYNTFTKKRMRWPKHIFRRDRATHCFPRNCVCVCIYICVCACACCAPVKLFCT